MYVHCLETLWVDVQADKKSKEVMQTCAHVLRKRRFGLALKATGAGRRSALWRVRRIPTPSTPAQAPSAKQVLQSSNNGLPAREKGVQKHLASSEASAASTPRTANSPATPAYPPLNMIQVNSFKAQVVVPPCKAALACLTAQMHCGICCHQLVCLKQACFVDPTVDNVCAYRMSPMSRMAMTASGE